MSDEKMKNIAIALLILTALISWLFQKSGEKVKLSSFVALAVILGLTLVAPLAGMILAVPIFLIVYFDHHTEVLAWWEKISKASLNLGGGSKQ